MPIAVTFAVTICSFFSGSPQEPQRGHRNVRPQDLDDLPVSWARQAKVAQLDNAIPETHDGLCVATFAGGCYWGPELTYQRQRGVVATCVGHTGFLSGGANEAVQLLYDPKETLYEKLCDVLWDYVDPTLKNQVGLDKGRLYRHTIYYHSPDQQRLALQSRARLQSITKGQIWTEVVPAELFYVAMPRHQRYLERGMKGDPQCASKGCTDPIRCYGGVRRRAGQPSMSMRATARDGMKTTCAPVITGRSAPVPCMPPRMQLSSGFEFDDGTMLLVSVQKPIGMVLEEAETSEEGCVVAEVLDESAASRAGIEAGFRLLAVNNMDVTGTRLEEVMAVLIQSPRVVNLRFERP